MLVRAKTAVVVATVGLVPGLMLSACHAQLDDRIRSSDLTTPRVAVSPTAAHTPTPTPASPSVPISSPSKPVPSFRPAIGVYVVVDKNHPKAFERDLDAVVTSGSRWIRMGIPSWVAGRITDGQFVAYEENVRFYVDAVKKADAAKLKIAFIQANALNSDSWTDEEFLDYNAQYWAYISSKFGKYVDLWQVFNEHDSADYRSQEALDTDHGFPDGYLDRMRVVLTTARNALRTHSKAPITSPPLGYPIDEDRYARWQEFFDAVGPALDVLSVHVYPGSSPETIGLVPRYLNRLKERYGKPVAVTEFGVPSVSANGTHTAIGAAIAQQINAIATADPLCAIVYQLRDRGTDTGDSEQAFGLLRHDFTRKSYYSTVIAEIKEENLIVYTSEVGSQSVRITWTGVAGSTSYVLGRDGLNAAGYGPWSIKEPAKARSRLFTGLRAGTTYTFTLRAVPSSVIKTVTVTTST